MTIEKEIFQIGTSIYPQPIALSCGRICRARNIQEQLDSILKCAEVVARYLAAIAIGSFCIREKADCPAPKGLEGFTSHLSFGHFLGVIQLIAATDCDHPLKKVLGETFKQKDDGQRQQADESLDRLFKLRNSLGHDLMGISEAKAVSVFAKDKPELLLKSALEALRFILRYPLFMFEEQRLVGGKIIARRLLLMGESSDPIPEEVEITSPLLNNKTLYIGVEGNVINLYPFLIWDIAKERATYSVYFIHGIYDKNIKFVTAHRDELAHNSELCKQVQSRISGEVYQKENTILTNGKDFLKEWSEQKKVIEKQLKEISGQIPWEDLDDDTLRWYGKHLGASEEEIKLKISEQVFDNRDFLPPEELKQVILLFGRKEVVKRTLGRDLIDCRAKKDPDKRWDDRVESHENVIECLKIAINFFAKHIGIDDPTLDGLRDTSGSADYVAMREGLVNLFIHQDYNDKTIVSQIEITPQRTKFFNAGKSLIGPNSLVEGGKSQSRNPLLSRALRLVGFAELAGSGLREVYRSWKTANRRPPITESSPSANSFTLTLDWREVINVPNEFWHKRLGVKLSEEEARILLLASDSTGLSKEEVAVSLGILIDEASNFTNKLIKDALVEEKKNRFYIKDHLKALVEEAKSKASS